jgi:hypothetical protein
MAQIAQRVQSNRSHKTNLVCAARAIIQIKSVEEVNISDHINAALNSHSANEMSIFEFYSERELQPVFAQSIILYFDILVIYVGFQIVSILDCGINEIYFRYQVHSDLNRIMPWTLSIISWGSILIASLVTDQLVGLNTQTRYSGLAIWAFGFFVSGWLGQQYNGAIQIIVSFLVSSLLQVSENRIWIPSLWTNEG